MKVALDVKKLSKAKTTRESPKSKKEKAKPKFIKFICFLCENTHFTRKTGQYYHLQCHFDITNFRCEGHNIIENGVEKVRMYYQLLISVPKAPSNFKFKMKSKYADIS